MFLKKTYYVVFVDSAGDYDSESFDNYTEARGHYHWVKYHEDAVRSLFYSCDASGYVTEHDRHDDLAAWRDEMDQADASDYAASKRLGF